MNTETAKQYETTVLYVLFLDTMVEIIVVGVVYQLPPYIRMRGGVRLPAVWETTYAVRPYDQQGCHTNRESPQIQMRQSGVVRVSTLQRGQYGSVVYLHRLCLGVGLLCTLCQNLPSPAMGARFTFLGKPAMLTPWMAGAAHHKSGLCRDKSRSNNHTQTSLDLRYLP